MGQAYECDKCGLFFPGQGHDRYLPSPKQRHETATTKAIGMTLCKNCMDEFDRKMYELHDIFRAAERRRAKNGIRSDAGHEEAT